MSLLEYVPEALMKRVTEPLVAGPVTQLIGTVFEGWGKRYG